MSRKKAKKPYEQIRFDDDTYYFNSGKTVYANNGILGIGFDGDVFGGYDGVLRDAEELSKDERRLLSEMVIERWRAWAEGKDHD